MNHLQKLVKIFAFEPINPIFEILQANINLHSIPSTHLFKYGLSSSNIPAQSFTFYPNMAGNSTTKPLEKLEQREVMNQALSNDMVEYLFQKQEVTGTLRTLSSVINEL